MTSIGKWFDELVRSESLEVFLDTILNRKQGVFWLYQNKVVLEFLRQDV